MECPHCGYDVPLRDVKVKFNGMYDMHLFTSFDGDSPEEIVKLWRMHNDDPNPAIVGDRKIDDLGPASLCPARIVAKNPMNGKTVERSVGKMVFPPSRYRPAEEVEGDIREWLEAIHGDREIMAWFAWRNAE